jgi:hypothetical protein
MGLAAWILPGAGHALQGRWGRGLILGLVVWLTFAFGLVWGGHLYPVTSPTDRGDGMSTLLQIPPAVANLGSGIAYLACWVTNTGFSDEPANEKRPTFEYGKIFLLVAGLLNYLAVLDAFDISAGRKT